MIKDFKPRLYQETILATAIEKNTLVVLPTGMGKTNVFLMLAAQRFRQYPNGKIMMLGPTKPLIDQYYQVFEKHFEIDPSLMAVFTGNVRPDKRAEAWKRCKIIFSTPQGLENDIISGRIDLKDVTLLGFDEAHKAVGNYAYVWIAEQYIKAARYPRILAMTASPGSEKEKISEICRKLYIEAVEVRSENDPDVKPYVQQVDIRWEEVELPPQFNEIKRLLDDCYKSKLTELFKNGVIDETRSKFMGRKEVLGLQAELQSRVAAGEKEYSILKGMSLAAEAMKVQHAIELLESQGIAALNKYIESIYEQAKTSKVKAVLNLANDINFHSARLKAEKLAEQRVEHPKLGRLSMIAEYQRDVNQGMKLIVFTQYRDSALSIIETLGRIPGIKPRIFVGQSKKGETGMSQKMQKEAIDRFKEGEFNVLVATQIAEEGLDIPSVDAVIFYEPTPSAIRHIQRKGRTGRLEKGEVIILVAKGTRDEAYKWSSHHKQKRMNRALNELKNDISFISNGNGNANGRNGAAETNWVGSASASKTNRGERADSSSSKLTDFMASGEKDPSITGGYSEETNSQKMRGKEQKVTIFADYREKDSGTIKALLDMGALMRLERLEVGDYLLSEDCAVELKKIPDFVNSLIDGRLLSQLKPLKESFTKPIVIVEGTEDIYSVRNVHPNAIRGLLTTITLNYRIPIIFSRNPLETAAFLHMMAKHEQLDEKKEVFMHSSKKPLTENELAEYIVSALPGVGPSLAKELLKRFGSIQAVFSATEKQLKDIDMIGDKKAKNIRGLIERKYYAD